MMEMGFIFFRNWIEVHIKVLVFLISNIVELENGFMVYSQSDHEKQVSAV